MIVHRIATPLLANYSYFVADGADAAIIDPRRDIAVYLELARKENKRIRYILETHRHEDFVLGSKELAAVTGAEIYRSAYEDLGYTDGCTLQDGDTLMIGAHPLRALHTPGHTRGHLSYVLYHQDAPYVIFTGDALFYGDVGRTDFYGKDNLKDMTDLAYDSIHEKIVPLGDDVIIMPAHGPGSACGAAIAELPSSTIGHERRTSPVFAVADRAEFQQKFGTMRFKPPYFTHIEAANVDGLSFLGDAMSLHPLSINGLLEQIAQNTVVDVRGLQAYAYHHLPNALFMGDGMLPKALGAYVDVNAPIVLVVDGLTQEKMEEAYWTLRRMGYDNIIGMVGNMMHLFMEAEGSMLESQPSLTAKEFMALKDDLQLVNLDVREPAEIMPGDVPFERLTIPLALIPEQLATLRDVAFVSSCYTGIRAAVVASYLASKGISGFYIRGNLTDL